ncbi:MAG: M28 family peptidase [Bacteroidia bacterium]|nr:M28 family peptidase [Bacteroidia bacterium]
MFYNLVPTGPAEFTIEGEIVFAGYGIKADKYNYNDFENIKTEGKILLVMNRAPMKEDGKTSHFEEPGWSSEMNFQLKLSTLILTKPKAILIVSDPKSGFDSFEESNPDIVGYLNSGSSLKGDKEKMPNPFMASLPKVLFIHRNLAEKLLSGSGFTLANLQKEIDNTLKSKSFEIPDKKLFIDSKISNKEIILNNIAGYIEGSDPVVKNEVVIFSGHYDHIGGTGDKVHPGADDDASGCAALLEMAQAFGSLKKKPSRTILFLWVSGEEIGLFGSESYTRSPLFPLEKTVADLNMDMIGRVKGVSDSTDQTPMSGPDTVFVITDNQSKELIAIADEVDKKSRIAFDYSLSGRGHPLQLFSRSDHYNFIEKDIPVLFFTTGLHSDYHTPGDVIEKLDFGKMELITRTMYEIGLEVANRKTRPVVDFPFSTWGTKNK